jgi:hypothetical protein
MKCWRTRRIELNEATVASCIWHTESRGRSFHKSTVRQRWSLFLNLFATTTQRDDLAVLSNSSDRRPAALIRRSPIGRNVFGTSDPEKFPQVVIPPPKLFHPVLDRIRVERISRIVWHLSSSPMSGFILLLTDERTFTLVNILPTEHLFSR